MTKAELERVVHLCTRDFKEFHLIMDAVEAYSSASNNDKPLVIRSVCDCQIPKPIDAYHDKDKHICRDCNGTIEQTDV